MAKCVPFGKCCFTTLHRTGKHGVYTMNNEQKQHNCCFFGHRKIKATDELKKRLYTVIENLITEKSVNVFLFGSKSEFDNLCHKITTKLMEKYPHIQRIYVRAEFPYINDEYRNYLLQSYEDTYYPEKMTGAGKAAYVERNREMVDNCGFCVIYYDDSYAPPRRRNSKSDLCDYQPKSGTKIAYEYAVKKGIEIINILKDKE